MKTALQFLGLVFIAFLLRGCVSAAIGIAPGVTPVTGFDADKYLGTWYEIARMDQRFERGLYNVTATYSLNDDGSIKVVNRGYKLSEQEWKSADGRAKFVGDNNEGHLKVSFFGPFYASYVVYDLGDDYQHAFITGSNKNVLWLLAREPTVSEELFTRFKEDAVEKGFDMSNMIFDVQREELPR